MQFATFEIENQTINLIRKYCSQLTGGWMHGVRIKVQQICRRITSFYFFICSNPRRIYTVFNHSGAIQPLKIFVLDWMRRARYDANRNKRKTKAMMKIRNDFIRTKNKMRSDNSFIMFCLWHSVRRCFRLLTISGNR